MPTACGNATTKPIVSLTPVAIQAVSSPDGPTMQLDIPAQRNQPTPDFERLHELNETGELYTLVDAAAAPEQADELVHFLKRVGAVNLFGTAREANHEQYVAWMVPPVRDPDARRYVLETFYTQSWRAPFVTWLQSTLPPHELGMRLQNRLKASVMGSEMLLRYYDPRVLPGLMKVMYGRQRTPWQALGTQWLYFDLSHRLQTIELPGATGYDPHSYTLAFDDTQADALMDMSELGQLISHCCDNYPDTFGKLSLQDRHDTANAARQIAQKTGFHVFDDYVRVTRLMTALGETSQLPVNWAAHLKRIHDGEMTWQQLPALPSQEQAR